MRKAMFLILKGVPIVVATTSFCRALFLLCGVPRRYSTPESLPDGSVNPLFDVNSLIDNLRVTLVHEDKANVALGMVILMLVVYIVMLHVERYWQRNGSGGDGRV